MCNCLESLRVDLMERIDGVVENFENKHVELRDRLNEHADQIGLASSNSFNSANNAKKSADSSDKALEAVEEIRKMLKAAHVDDAAVIFKGGERMAAGVVWWAKVLAALGFLYASWSHIDWLYWWHVLTNGRPH